MQHCFTTKAYSTVSRYVSSRLNMTWCLLCGLVKQCGENDRVDIILRFQKHLDRWGEKMRSHFVPTHPRFYGQIWTIFPFVSPGQSTYVLPTAGGHWNASKHARVCVCLLARTERFHQTNPFVESRIRNWKRKREKQQRAADWELLIWCF